MFTKNLKKVMFTFFTALAFIFLLGACQFGNVSQELVDARSDLKEAAARVLVKGEETKTITLTDDINLNGFIVGGATVKWESSNEKYAQVVPNTEDNNYVLKVRRPKPNEETVTLTLKATISLDYLDADGETKTLSTVKRFTVEITPSPAPKSLSEVKVEAAEAIKNNKEYNASFYGTVTYVIPGTGNGQFYVTDGETSMYVFVAKEGIKAGDVVNVQGKIVEYYGMLEVDKSNAKVEILTANEEGQYVDDEGQVIFGSDGTPLKAVTPTYTETTVVDLYDTEKYPNAVAYSGNTVNVYGLLTYEKYRGESNTNFYLVDVESGKRLAIYYKSYTDEQKKVLETFAGKYVTIDAIAHDFYTSAPGPFRRLLVNADSVKEAAAPVLTDQQQADYIIGTLFLSESYGVDFTLPTEATWEVVSGTGIEIVDGVAKVTKTEAEQTVVLKATVKVNDAVATKEFTVVVESLKIEYITPSEALENLQKDEFNGKTVYVKGFISQGTYSNENFLNKYGNFFLKGTDGVEVKIYGKFGKDAQGNYVFPTLKEQLGLAEGVCVGIKGTYSNGFGNIEGLEIITVEIPELTDQEKADAIASKLTLKGAYGADFTLPTEATWEVVSGTGIEIVDGVAKVTKAETEQTVVLKATVKVNDAVATKEFTVVVERLNQAAMTVAEVLALVDDASVKVVAKVVAIYARGYVVADNTGNVLVYFGSSFSQDFNIGDVVLVEGTKGTFNKGVQIASPTVTASTETVELTETAPKELTAADLDAYASSTVVTVELVKLTGKLTISNNKYYNVAIDGTSKQGSISFPLTGLVDSNLNGKKVVVTGYVFSVSGGRYVNIVAMSVTEEGGETPVLTDQEKADAIASKLTLKGAYGADFTLPTEATWEVVSGTGIEIVDGVAKVTKAETEQTVVLKATVKVNDAVATKEFTVVVESLNQAAMTVAEVLALTDDASVKVVAKVVAIYARGYVVADNTGNVLVYFGSSFSQDFNIGDVVLVEGTKGTFNKGVQIASPTVTASTETVELTETAPKELTAADLDAYASSTVVTVELVKLTGKLTIRDNKYYNVAIDGTSKQGSISFPLTGLVDSNLNGKKVVVTGYVFSVSGTNYINIMALSVAEVGLTDAEKVAEALAKVSAPATATEDFTLVEVGGVVWSLKAESVAATLAGNTVKVNRQSTDTEIVIVATATFGEVTDSKEFTVTVLAEGTVVTEKTLTIDFSTATGTGTQVSDAATFVNTYASVNILKSATATNVYDGNGAGGKWANSKGFVKMGTGKKNGVLTLTFNEGVKVSKVVLNCYAWDSGKTDKVTVGTSTVALPNGDAAEDLEFTLGGVNEFTITSAKRMFLFSITVSYTE